MKQEPIYGRIKATVDAANGRPVSLLLGVSEWDELKLLCKKWGHDWPPGGEEYSPQEIENMRAEFMGKKIYRVDAATFLAAF